MATLSLAQLLKNEISIKIVEYKYFMTHYLSLVFPITY